MSIKAPLITRIPPVVWPVELLTWVHYGQTSAPVATPPAPAQRDWPNPVPAAPRSVDLLTWISRGPITPPNGRQTDWPNPVVTLQRSVDLLTWTASARVTPPPIPGKDWPNPTLAAPRSVDLLTWINRSPVIPPNGRQSDWLNPVVSLPRSIDALTWTQWGAITPPPGRQLDWPNPTLPKQSFDLLTWVQSAAVTPPAAPSPPINQYNWPNPQPLPPNLELNTWINTGVQPTPAPVPVAPPDTHDGYIANTQVLSERDWKRKLAELRGEKPKPVNQVVERADLKAASLKAPGAVISQRDTPEDEDIILGAIADEETAITSLLAEAAAFLVKHRLH